MRVNSFDRYDLVNNIGEDKPSFTIWFAGCSVRCEGCHNTKLWDKNQGTEYTPFELVDMIIEQPVKYDTVVLLGGEPLEQNSRELLILCKALKILDYKVWLYTSHELDEVPQEILDSIHVIKTGKFDINSRTEDGSILSSTNQSLYIKQNGEWGNFNES